LEAGVGIEPAFAALQAVDATEGKVHDVKVAQQLRFAPDTVVVDDRGYVSVRGTRIDEPTLMI
jgi:hypothetical protein